MKEIILVRKYMQDKKEYLKRLLEKAKAIAEKSKDPVIRKKIKDKIKY